MPTILAKNTVYEIPIFHLIYAIIFHHFLHLFIFHWSFQRKLSLILLSLSELKQTLWDLH